MPDIEQPQIPTLKDFLAYTRTHGLSRSDRFMTVFYPPEGIFGTGGIDSNAMTLLCEEAGFPGKSITPRPLRINSITERRASTVDYGGEISFQFIVDGLWIPRNFIEQWMLLCVEINQDSFNSGRGFVEGGRAIGFYDDYVGTIDLFALVPSMYYSVSNPSSTAAIGLNRGRLDGSIAHNAKERLNRIANDHLDKIRTNAKNYIDPKALSMFHDVERVMNQYHGGDDPNADIPPERAVWGMTLHECWPQSFNIQQVGYGNHGFNRLTVTFAYKYWASHFNKFLGLSEATPLSTPLLDRINTGTIKNLLPHKIPSGIPSL